MDTVRLSVCVLNERKRILLIQYMQVFGKMMCLMVKGLMLTQMGGGMITLKLPQNLPSIIDTKEIG
jgi:hypothetical protein